MNAYIAFSLIAKRRELCKQQHNRDCAFSRLLKGFINRCDDCTLPTQRDTLTVELDIIL